MISAVPSARSERLTAAPEGRVAVRSGDPAPGSARFGRGFQSVATGPGGLLFIDAAGTALFRKSGDATSLIAYVGQTTAGGRSIASLGGVAAAADGTIVFFANLADRGQGVFRVTPGGGPPEEVVLTNDILQLRDGPATVGFHYGAAVDADGAVLEALGFFEVPPAIVRFPRGSSPQIVIQPGDPLGPGTFAGPIAGPAVNAQGRIVLSAWLNTGDAVVSTMAPGDTPVVLYMLPPAVLPQDPFLAGVPPAINDAGEVAFLLVDRGTLKVREISNGFGFTAAQRGMPAPGGGTISTITDFPPVIDPAGRVLFGAQRSNGRQGLYLASSSITRLAEEGMPAGDAGSLTHLDVALGLAAASLAADGTLHFAADATSASGIFSSTGTAAAAEVRSGDAVPGPRFASFLDARVPFLGGGPSLAPGGLMIFDATVSGGSRGLFVRDRAGAITPVASDGDPAPGGGHFAGRNFSFSTINESGAFAFLGCAPDTGPTPMISLYYGNLGGVLRRVVDTQVVPPGAGGGFGGGIPADRLAGAPSRVNRLGQVTVPVRQVDGTSVLMGYDGSSLFRVAGPGDAAPGGDVFANAFTGSLFTGQPVPPVLGDDGSLLFGAQTAAGDSALYATHLAAGGGGVPVRVLGLANDVPGGRLSPFEVQGLDRDASGSVAFQSIYNDDYYFADFVKGAGPPIRVAARLDPVLDLGNVLSVTPSLAFMGEGTLAYGAALFDGSTVILAGSPGEGDPLVIASTGGTSPDGGAYLSFQSLQANTQRPGRLASDGRGTLALAASTTAGPEEIVLFGRANEPPAANAGPDLAVECAGPAGTSVTLDGGGSSDPEGGSLGYHWSWPSGEAEGARPAVVLPLGVTTVTLVVDDGELSSAPDTVVIEVRDTTPPFVVALAAPGLLWPPDGRLVKVSFDVAARDLCDPYPAITLVAVTSSEPGAGRPWPQSADAVIGTDDRGVSLRADRLGTGSGRTYLVTYRATDRSGNSSEAGATVVVPHDQRH